MPDKNIAMRAIKNKYLAKNDEDGSLMIGGYFHQQERKIFTSSVRERTN